MATGEFGRGKTIFVLAVVIGCFAILWPKIFYPMLTASLNPSAEEGEQCCDVIFVKDTNAHKILNEICANIIRKEIEALSSATESRGVKAKAPPKIQIPSTNLCRDDILKTCGVDVVYLIKENPAITKGYKESLTQLRAYNTSQCMKNNYGVDFQEIGLPRKAKHDALPSHMRPERPLHFRPDMMHPALREKGRAIHSPLPQRTIEKEARPGPMPGVRPPIGGAGHVPQSPKGGGTMGIIMPIYTIGIVVFFFYTIMKVFNILFRKSDEERQDLPLPAPVQPQIKDFGMDPEHRKFVFAEEYVDKSERSLKDELGKQDRDLGIKRRPPGGKNRSGDERRRLENEAEQFPEQTIETHVTDITQGSGSSGQSLGEASTLAWLSYELPGDSSSPAFQNEFLLSKSIEPVTDTQPPAKTLEIKPTKSLQLQLPSFAPPVKEKITITAPKSEPKSKSHLPDAEILDEFEALSAEILPDDFESISTVFDDIFLKSQEHESLLLYPTPTTSLTTTPQALTPEPSDTKSFPPDNINSSDTYEIESDILPSCISTNSESLEKQVKSVIEESPIIPTARSETTEIPVAIESEHESSDLEPPAFIPPEPVKPSERISDDVPLSPELESEIDSVLDTIKEAGEILADLVEEQNEHDKSHTLINVVSEPVAEQMNVPIPEIITEVTPEKEFVTPEPVSIVVEDLDPNVGERSALSPGKVEFEEILDTVESSETEPTEIEMLSEAPRKFSPINILEELSEENVQDAIIPETVEKKVERTDETIPKSEEISRKVSTDSTILGNIESQLTRKESSDIKDILDIKETAMKISSEILSDVLESCSNLEIPIQEPLAKVEKEKALLESILEPNITAAASKITSDIISSALDSCKSVDSSDIFSNLGPVELLEPELLTSPIADDISAHYLTDSKDSQIVDTIEATEGFVDIPTNNLQFLEESSDRLLDSFDSSVETPFQTPNIESLIAAAQEALNEPPSMMTYADVVESHGSESDSEVGTPTNDLLCPPFLEESSDPVVETLPSVESPVEPPSVESLIAAAQEALKIPPPITTYAETVESHREDQSPQQETSTVASPLQTPEPDESSNVDEEGMIEIMPTIDETDEKPGETSVEDETTSKSVDLTSSSISQIAAISVDPLLPSQETIVSEQSSPKLPVELTSTPVEGVTEIPASTPEPNIPSDSIDTEKTVESSSSEQQESVVSLPENTNLEIDNSEKIITEETKTVPEPSVDTNVQTPELSGVLEQEEKPQVAEIVETLSETQTNAEIDQELPKIPKDEKSEQLSQITDTPQIIQKTDETPDVTGVTTPVEKEEESLEINKTAEILEKAIETPSISETSEKLDKTDEQSITEGTKTVPETTIIPDIQTSDPSAQEEKPQVAEIDEKLPEAQTNVENDQEIPKCPKDENLEKEESPEITTTAEISLEKPITTSTISDTSEKLDKTDDMTPQIEIAEIVETPEAKSTVSVEETDKTLEPAEKPSETIEITKTTDSGEQTDEKLEVPKPTEKSEESKSTEPLVIKPEIEQAAESVEKVEETPNTQITSTTESSEKPNETSEATKTIEIVEQAPKIAEAIQDVDKSTEIVDVSQEESKVAENVEETQKLQSATILENQESSPLTEIIEKSAKASETPGIEIIPEKSIDSPGVSESQVVEQISEIEIIEEPIKVETVELQSVPSETENLIVESRGPEQSEEIKVESKPSGKTEVEELGASQPSSDLSQSMQLSLDTKPAETATIIESTSEIAKECEIIADKPEPVSSECSATDKVEDSLPTSESQTGMPSVVELSLSASVDVSIVKPDILPEPAKVVERVEPGETATATVAEPVDTQSAERTAIEESGMEVEANVTANTMALASAESESPALDSLAHGIDISPPPVLETDSVETATDISAPPSSLDGKSGESQRSQAVASTTDSSGSAKAHNEQGAQDANESGHRDRDATLKGIIEAMDKSSPPKPTSESESESKSKPETQAPEKTEEELGSSSEKTVPKSKATSQSAEKESPEKVQAQEGKAKKRVQIELPKKDQTSEEEEEEEEDSSSFARPPTPPRTVSIKPKQQQTRTSESKWQSKDNNSMINYAQDLSASIVNQSAAAAIAKAKAAANAPAGEKVSVVGFEESFSMESGKKWNERSPTPTNRVSSPLPRAPTPPEDIPSIFLAGPMPASANQLLVSDPQIEIEGEEGDYDDDDYDLSSAPVVLSGKVTLSVISGGADDITEPPSVSLDDHGRADRDPNSRGHSSAIGDGKSKKGASNVQKSSKASSPDMDEYEVVAKGGFNDADLEDDADLTYYSTATDAEAEIGGNETAGDISQMEGLEDTSKDDILDDEEEEEDEEEE